MDDIFTNREIAIIIWIATIIVYILSKKKTRSWIPNIIKSILKIKILILFFLYLGYFSIIIYFFYHLNWWDVNNLKDTITWFIFSGLPIGISVSTKKLESGFWKSLVLDNLKLMVLVEFIINSFTFSLAFEFFFLIPFVTIITTLNAFCKHKKEYNDVEKLTNTIIAFFGFFILSYSLYRVVVEIQSIENMNTLNTILFPAVYSIISVPYMYFLKLFIEYEDNAIIRKYNKDLFSESDKSKPAQTRTVQITPVVTQKSKVSTNINESETILKFSDGKKEELVGYITELCNAQEVEVIFIPSSNTSSNSLLSIDYYIDATPTRTFLDHNIANIVILSESLAEESGISNLNVSVCAKIMDGTPLGIGNYYSSTGKAFIDVSSCPEL